MTLQELYLLWLDYYGPQGWWPVKSARDGVNASGYHPGNFSFPRTPRERLEILLGALLTQNTSWRNVSMVLKQMIDKDLLAPEKLRSLSQEELAQLIRSAGYHRQKAKKLHILLDFLSEGDYLQGAIPSRESLLGCWGIGPETADSMRLYAYAQKEFVIDRYTSRILSRLGFQPEKDTYQAWKDFAVSHLPDTLECYQEFHGLILAHAKAHCGAKAQCSRCPVKDTCNYDCLNTR